MNRTKFLNLETEHSITSNIDQMIRIKLALERKIDISNNDEVEIMKKANSIEDSAVNEFYRNLQQSIGGNPQILSLALAEIKGLFASLLNNESDAEKIAEALHKDHSVTEFKDLTRISKAEYYNVLRRNTNLAEQDVERVVKSILASLH